jgi:Na+-translocating ferredoxin:NAD+ oxidoreductase subunit B
MDVLSTFSSSLKAALALGGLGVGFAALLFIAFKKLAVKTDPKVDLVLLQLPGSNCGACGFAGCQGLAEKAVSDTSLVTGCLAGGQAVAQKLAEVLGVSLDADEDKIAFVACRAGNRTAQMKYIYEGVGNCQAANLFFGGDKACQAGCLGLESCVHACPFDAIHMNDERVAVVDPDKCKSCEKCVAACPRHLIAMYPKSQDVLVACANHDRGPQAKRVCPISCTACKICEKNCPEKAITVIDNLAVIDPVKCKGHGICIEKCPQKTIIRLSHLVTGNKTKEPAAVAGGHCGQIPAGA